MVSQTDVTKPSMRDKKKKHTHTHTHKQKKQTNKNRTKQNKNKTKKQTKQKNLTDKGKQGTTSEKASLIEGEPIM